MGEITARLSTALADRYGIERRLGDGGMATVYLAEDLKHHRKVAIKVLKPELAPVLGAERFVQEIKTTAHLQHPHILPLFDSGEADGFLYYVMPFIDGETVREKLNRETQFGVDEAVRIATEVADALDYAHRHDVIHRDIKPENILFEGGHAVVADFGIARAVTAAGGEGLTETGMTIGTPKYMSPEQAAGSGELDGRSDLYSLGCVLYEMLAGQPPFTGSTAASVIAQHLTAELPDVAVIRPAVPAGVVDALARVLAKTPADRFASADVFVEALAKRESAAPVSAHGARPALGSWRRPALLGVLLVVVVGAALGIGRWMGGIPAGEPGHPLTAIAVLPFQNLSADGPYAYFAGGLQDEVLTQLAKVAALSVRGRTSVMGYVGTTKSVRQIAEELEVGTLLEGSVQVMGDRLRVIVQLLDATTDEHLWAESYDRTLDDAFAIQSDVAQQVVTAVGAALGGSEERSLAQSPTENAEAYRLYLQGREYWRKLGYQRQNWEIAQQLYERALALDSTFALAHVELSVVNGAMSWYRYDTSPERLVRQREEAETALRLAPDLPQAHMAMGFAHYSGHRDWQAALDEFGIALQALPNDAVLWTWIGYAHRRLGNWDEVDAAVEKATQLDPRNVALFFDLGGGTFSLTRRYADAVAAYNRALTLAPDMKIAPVAKGLAYLNWGRELDTLRAALERLPPDAELGDLGTARAQRVRLVLFERKPDSLLSVLGSAPDAVFEGRWTFLPTSLYAAWAHELRGDDVAAQAAFESARSLLDSVLPELPDDWRVHAARGLALAGLDRRDDALREARWLEQSVVYREDAYDGPFVAEERARILARAGEVDAALDEIERLLAGPGFLSVQTLRLDPRWDPIREHPRFQRLLERYGS
jgi:eukaryotic-like serine/threonine-protein kinase